MDSFKRCLTITIGIVKYISLLMRSASVDFKGRTPGAKIMMFVWLIQLNESLIMNREKGSLTNEDKCHMDLSKNIQY